MLLLEKRKECMPFFSLSFYVLPNAEQDICNFIVEKWENLSKK